MDRLNDWIGVMWLGVALLVCASVVAVVGGAPALLAGALIVVTLAGGVATMALHVASTGGGRR